MELPRSSALVARLQWLDEAGSTNSELVRLATADEAGWPAPSVLVTDVQTAGRGRLGRAWTAPPGASLAVSVLLRPAVPRDRLGWLSLLAGTAMARALAGLGVAASTKWPNDVLVGGRKICGVLAEALPDGGAVIGTGLNHRLAEEALPVPTATSLAIEGGPTDPDLLLAAYLTELLALAERFAAAKGDPDASGVREAVLAISGTIGRAVRVSLPDGTALVGTAVGIDADGRVEVRAEADSRITAVASGDVEHLRYE
ncbi:biotin--[acetyl-CoA-carboxylase] ligase [Amnibacterium sp. CER49]|uniref:biotin--[acetyl-CoA-carboxylase] ligase n=1 Tax=Amnibacterium sp. CER49 TaxID=3039161 RepID=UPI0024475764|nr:biotin--[acetyl-CoA-carboxylase] ligase [Amnibacterium sp. CER49]MDH2443093.1 biotin--[acetyl-CoA-carboxylase] ligase [Amnibacterium sp. CER49]